jgi:hypothetical protein
MMAQPAFLLEVACFQLITINANIMGKSDMLDVRGGSIVITRWELVLRELR